MLFRVCTRWTIRCFAYMETLTPYFDGLIRFMGPLLVAVAILLIGGCILLYFTVLLPYYRRMRWTPDHMDAWTCIHCVLAIWLSTMVTFHYYKAVTTDAGSPPVYVEQQHDVVVDMPAVFEHASISASSSPLMTSSTGPSTLRVCAKCKRIKPARAHHCSMCHRCILRFDHHCPWINVRRFFHSFPYYYCLIC